MKAAAPMPFIVKLAAIYSIAMTLASVALMEFVALT